MNVMIYVHFQFSIIPKKITASRSIQAERCNFIAFYQICEVNTL